MNYIKTNLFFKYYVSYYSFIVIATRSFFKVKFKLNSKIVIDCKQQ